MPTKKHKKNKAYRSFGFAKKIAALIFKIITLGTSERYPDYFNARLKGINIIFLAASLVQILGVSLLSIFYPITLEQFIQTFSTVFINFLLLYLHYKQQFKISELIFSSTILLGILTVQILYIVPPFSIAIFVFAGGMWYFNYTENFKTTLFFTFLMTVLSLTINRLINLNLIQPYIEAKSDVFNGNFASSVALLFGIVFFIFNARIYKNEVVKRKKGKLSLKRNKKTIFLSEQDILFLKADRNYVEVHMKDGKQWVEKQSLSNFSKKLDPSNFVQIHKSYWINKNHIVKISKEEVIINEFQLPLGRKFKPFLQTSQLR